MELKRKPAYPRGNLFIKYNLLARIYFCWVDPLFCYGARHTLEQDNLYAHPPEADSEYLLKQFNKYWSTEVGYYNKGGTPRMWRALAKVFWWRILIHGISSFLLAMFFVAQGIVLGHITDYFTIDNPTTADTKRVYIFASIMAMLSAILVTNNSLNAYIGIKMGMLLRIICTSAIYQKILRLSQNTIGVLTSGRLINLASNDVYRFDQAMIFYHFFWVGPIHLALVNYFIYQEIGATSFLATVLVLVQIPLQVILAKSFIKLRLRAASKTDERVKVMNEVIVGIRVIKMYGWEHAFQRMVAHLRKQEVGIILKGSIIRAINLSYYILALPTIMFVVFSVYASIEGTCSLTPKKVFTTLSLLTFVRLTSVNFLLKGIIQVAEAKVALKRITDLLLQDELGSKCLPDKPSHQSNGVSSTNPLTIELTDDVNDEPQLTVDNLCASWSNDPDRLSLRNISFIVDRSAPLLAVVGTVGSGKSTLLQCLLGELPLVSGSLKKTGRIGYSTQEPWIFSDTLKENILFGLPYESEWYDRVIEACSLDKDIDILPHGDLTLVGERGVTLSGGQKARVSLARAVYSKPDICLLDDPLSAVDAAVSRHLFDSCIRSLLSDSCLVVLVTHQLQYIHQCDRVMGLKEGDVMFYGEPSAVVSMGIDFSNIFEEKKDVNNQKQQQNDNDDDPREMFAVRKYSIIPFDTTKLIKDNQIQESIVEEDSDSSSLVDDDISSPFVSEATVDEPLIINKKQSKSEQLPAEERAQGTIGIKIYYKYFIAGGGHIFTFFVFFSFLFGEGTVVASDLLISLWADCGIDCNNNTLCSLGNKGLTGIYGGLIGSVWVTCVGRTILFYILSLRAARILHNKMFDTVIRTPVLFFDTNPVGRILNRFSKDIGFLDDILIFSFCEFIQLFSRFLAIMAVSIASNYYLIVVVIILMVLFGCFRWYYLQTARSIKRLEAVARSPLYSHISMTIHGLPTIRSYSKQEDTIQRFHHYHNNHSQAWDAYIVSSRWFGIRIDAMSSLFVIILFFLSILLVNVLNLNRAVVGLALTYSLSLNGMFQYCVRQSAEVENYMVSTERVLSYCNLQSERSLETLPVSNKPSPSWPEKGQLTIKDLSYSHSKDGPCVLKGLNFTVQSGEKIGIVGRTGAGKSSLIASFFRLAEPQGSIIIDGVQCLDVGLHDVRTKIAIIPQDPMLFSGTIRYNLDPFGNYDDDKIWRALNQVQLEGLIQSLEGGLDALITEGGNNFSVGQRQLFCLSRALLKNNKILMLDEATANVDLETDAIIQQVIRDQFIDCTVLTIAHRLDTVMDSDKIMVLRVGEILEYDEPHLLLCNPDSYLLRLVEHTGPIAAEKLKAMALKAYNDKREHHVSSL